MDYPEMYQFPGFSSGTPFALMETNESRWLFWTAFVPDAYAGSWERIGITRTNGIYSMEAGYRNWFGLPFVSAKLAWGDSVAQTAILNAGGALAAGNGFFYPEAAQPILASAGYFFGRVGTDWLPGHAAFSTTNQTPLILTGVGKRTEIASYAKYTIANGYTNRPAYLGLYFDQAFRANPDGTRGTNQTGVLSPHGEFVATEPGKVFLTTKPDGVSTNIGECVVNVIKLQLDVNHDGIMDLSWSGPDNTSPEKPFVFWINNDYDRSVSVSGEEDDVSSNDRAAICPYRQRPTQDYDYRISLSDRTIPSKRDLEDFARLWIVGTTSDLLASLPPGTWSELSWGDKDDPNPNNPTIDLFLAQDSDGGICYLTNYLTTISQTNWVQNPGARLGPGQSITVSTNGGGLWRFIWCGVAKGSGKLTLTFRQGTNTLAETSTYIEIKDVKEMYERWTVGDKPQDAPANNAYLAREDLPVGAPPFQYATPGDTDTPYILMVHDWDLPTWKKDRYAETAFKRLYWQGYQGRFGLFRWPGVYNGIVRPLDDSEFNAWRSAAGLLSLLTNLDASHPGKVHLMAHGYGAIAAGEALRLAGSNEVVNTYIAMQGAVPAHAYDTSWAWRSLGSDESFTPNRYFWYYTNGAPCYFAGVGGAAAYINYYNTNDFALTNDWIRTQNTKPDVGYQWNGTNFSKGFIPGFYTPLVFPTDTYEIFSYCDEARCEAIGAQPSLGGPFFGMPNLDVTTIADTTGILGAKHDGQFKSCCADVWEFWHAVLKSLGLKQ